MSAGCSGSEDDIKETVTDNNVTDSDVSLSSDDETIDGEHITEDESNVSGENVADDEQSETTGADTASDSTVTSGTGGGESETTSSKLSDESGGADLTEELQTTNAGVAYCLFRIGRKIYIRAEEERSDGLGYFRGSYFSHFRKFLSSLDELIISHKMKKRKSFFGSAFFRFSISRYRGIWAWEAPSGRMRRGHAGTKRRLFLWKARIWSPDTVARERSISRL